MGVFFFFKKKTANEICYGYVGTEMCKRDGEKHKGGGGILKIEVLVANPIIKLSFY